MFLNLASVLNQVQRVLIDKERGEIYEENYLRAVKQMQVDLEMQCWGDDVCGKSRLIGEALRLMDNC